MVKNKETSEQALIEIFTDVRNTKVQIGDPQNEGLFYSRNNRKGILASNLAAANNFHYFSLSFDEVENAIDEQ